jgi:hypothetical protein
MPRRIAPNSMVVSSANAPLEELRLALMSLRGFAGFEGAKICGACLPGVRLAGVRAISPV